MFELSWVRLHRPDTPIETGRTVGVLAHVGGLWSLNACRVVYVLEEEAPIRRRGFGYGTLPDHVEKGEERFSIEWHPGDDSVWYDILAFSRPRHWLVRTLSPMCRRLQERFARDSLRAMVTAVRESRG
jgi:uncharacterized protein (UPF0548 family)